MTNVVRLAVEHSTFQAGWDVLPSTMRKRSEGLSILRPLWNTHAKLAGGQDQLLGALRAYIAGDPDIKRSGGPGLGPWLRARRYEHWIPDSITPAGWSTGTSFPEPHRTLAVGACGEGWVRSYLDPCTIEGTTLIVNTDFAIRKIKEQAPLFKRLGFTGMRKRKP